MLFEQKKKKIAGKYLKEDILGETIIKLSEEILEQFAREIFDYFSGRVFERTDEIILQ